MLPLVCTADIQHQKYILSHFSQNFYYFFLKVVTDLIFYKESRYFWCSLDEMYMKSFFLANTTLDPMSRIEKKNYGYKLKLLKSVIENNGMTQAEICRQLNISSPKALALINSLIDEGIIEQNEKASSIGGRKPVLNKIKDGTLLVLCIEIERFSIRLAIVDNNNNILKSAGPQAFTLTRDQSAITQLKQLITDFIAGTDLDWDRVMGIGLRMPGLIHAGEGANYTYMTGVTGGTPLRDILSADFHKPVYLINDVKSSAIAELKFGLARNRKDVLVILMDWGIGLGIILDGKLRNGVAGFSGEMGHMPFVEDGALCYCGKKGCLETVASGIALARMAKEGILSGKDSLLNELSDQEIDKIEPQLVINAANRGDQYAINILSDLGEKLGKGIATLIQLFNPELIILAGKIAEAQQYITLPIQQSINAYCMPAIRELAQVELSQLGRDAGAMGIARITLEELLNEHITAAEH